MDQLNPGAAVNRCHSIRPEGQSDSMVCRMPLPRHGPGGLVIGRGPVSVAPAD
jgi:hypothetical protein